MIGKTLAHYEIIAEIGRGGMGEVYRARDTKLGREVALKLLPPDFASDPERLHRFEREARVLASLSHSHIATIHDFEKDGDHRFLVLELVEGEDLAERVARGRISTHQALTIACQIAEGMEAAHERGIIHRDLKPANIKLTREGSVKILDFGLARIADAEVAPANLESSPTITADHTREGTLLGTAPYMSPEQLRGQPVDARTDIWAFGCVFYEMLTGASPFRAESSPEIMARILEHEPDWDKLPADVAPPTRRLLRRCLAKDPRQRLHSAADIRIVLQEAVAGDTDPPAASAPPRRSTALRIGIVAVAAFVLGALAFAMLRPRGPQIEPSRESARLMVPLRGKAALIPLPEAPSVAISPDGRTIVYVASSGLGGTQGTEAEFSNTQLYRRPIDSFESTPIRGTVGAAAPFFSPDGQWVAYFDFSQGMLRKVAVNGGTPIDVCFVEELTFRGACWPEGGDIYYADGASIFAVRDEGGTPRPVASPDHDAGEKTYRRPDRLPGKNALLFMRASSEILTYDDADIALLDLDSGKIRLLARGGLNPQYVPTGHIIFGRSGKVFALPFDLDRLEVTGAPVEVLDGVVTSDGYGSLQLSCSRNGTLVYVAGGPEQFAKELLILHRDGRVETIPQPARPYGNVSLSPSGNRFVVSVLGANASLWVYDLARGTMTRLVSGWDNFSPVWDSSGERIAFAVNRGGKNAVWLATPDGSRAPEMYFDRIGNAYPSSWSPDGELLAVSCISATTGMDVWIVNGDGTGGPAIRSAAREMNGRFSPDGRYIAYTSDESGRIEVYVQTIPISGRKWKLSEDGGDMPLWSRDGNDIYYWSGQRLMVVSVERDPELRPGRAREVLEAAVEVQDYDIFPDDERFIVLGRTSTRERAAAVTARAAVQGRLFPAQSPDLHVVLNWFDELERVAAQR